ncbi:hypothetical protein [[Phormidium] sp. ETS-05]|uniref:hypothetical protein n=1 Tax=[Phormidium] sp. ETS-05 TaxID=222819 RepID=UPI0018EEF98C|nr:hypothetical protein [[Phormidium] sp. ETS-05]
MLAPINSNKFKIIPTVAIVGLVALAQWLTGDSGKSPDTHQAKRRPHRQETPATNTPHQDQPGAQTKAGMPKVTAAGIGKNWRERLQPSGNHQFSGNAVTIPQSQATTNNNWGKRLRAVTGWDTIQKFSARATDAKSTPEMSEVLTLRRGGGIGQTRTPKPLQIMDFRPHRSPQRGTQAVWRTGFLDANPQALFNPNQLLPPVQVLLDLVNSRYGYPEGSLLLASPTSSAVWEFSPHPFHKLQTHSSETFLAANPRQLLTQPKVSWLKPNPPSNSPNSAPQTVSDTAKSKAKRRKTPEQLLNDLFSTPDAPGPIAIGAAEGTRTHSGGTTDLYWGHADPANGVNNLGTFSYQHGASTPRDADWLQLQRLKGQLKYIIAKAQEQKVQLSTLELVAAADLTNQSPAAGKDFVANLKKPAPGDSKIWMRW